jgi:hypothetical protein
MNKQQIEDLFLAIDVLITKRINNPNDTFEQFEERRNNIISQVLMAMKIKDNEPTKIKET